MGSGEVGEVDEHESVEGSVGEHGFERDVGGRKQRKGVLKESTKLNVLGCFASDDISNVGVEDGNSFLEAQKGSFQ